MVMVIGILTYFDVSFSAKILAVGLITEVLILLFFDAMLLAKRHIYWHGVPQHHRQVYLLTRPRGHAAAGARQDAPEVALPAHRVHTFALGTAAGDYVAGPLNMGTLDATFIFLGVIILPFIGYKWLKLNMVFAFWFAYTITRPLGASFGDRLGVPAPHGDGLQLGTGPMSLATGLLLLAVIAYIVIRHRMTSARETMAA